jgi:hypothetical protein
MGDAATVGRRHDDELGYLRGLGDPEFFSHWAAARTRLALTSTSSPRYSEIKREYGALAAEYRRRLDGAPHELAS